MMKKVYVVVLAAMVLLLSGCGEPKIDASSDKALEASIEKIMDELPDEKRAEFQQALTVLIMSEALSGLGSMANSMMGKEVEKQPSLEERLDGMTADDVIAAAKERNQ